MNDRINEIRETNAACHSIGASNLTTTAISVLLDNCDFLLTEIDRLTEAHGWIPTAEKMPEEPYGCLLMVEEDDHYGEPQKVLLPYFAGYDGAGWNDGEGKRIPFEVTHWMPLPAAQKGE